VPLPGIPLWNQDIVLYHGTLDMHVASILQEVDLNKCKHLRDFGRGFYTTTKCTQAACARPIGKRHPVLEAEEPPE
jgi:hypothetical protein